jgi:hypothetical protein
MAEFASLDAYGQFQRKVRLKARYIHDVTTREFIDLVLATSEARVKMLPKGHVLFRAQRGFTWRQERVGEPDEIDMIESAFGPERMVPNAECAGEGRVNVARIPCLYLATNRNTAMAEVRPWIGSKISVAEFKAVRECRIVDCSMDQKRSWDFIRVDLDDLDKLQPEPTGAEKEAGIWGDIAHAFSEPVSMDEPRSDYIPTQILGEAFREHGYDGIMYKSLLDERGKNIALFDLGSAELINCGLYETKSVTFAFSQADNPYFIVKHYPEIMKSLAKQG